MRIMLAIVLALAGCETVVDFSALREHGEQCRDGVDNDGDGAIDCADLGCAGRSVCLGCGNGILETNEECDDGNLASNDGCGPACAIEMCGDGIPNFGELCDDGNDDDSDGCVAGCKIPACGDGFVQLGVEQCDDTNQALDDGCTPSCVRERCGDGTTQNGPPVEFIEVAWLASSCVGDRSIQFRINGAPLFSGSADPGTCSCAPPTGFTQQVASSEAQILNGLNEFSVEYSGPGLFLAWAVVLVHTGSATQEIVVYEGAPGAAANRVKSLCSGGFDDNVPVQSVTRPVVAFEACDDGNSIDGDGCETTCTPSGTP